LIGFFFCWDYLWIRRWVCGDNGIIRIRERRSARIKMLSQLDWPVHETGTPPWDPLHWIYV
jgi:hypothetical protein